MRTAPIALALALAATGCGGGGEVAARGPHHDVIVAAAQEATSDFERQVLEDGEITRAEYEEAVHRLVECARDRGTRVTPLEQDGLYTYEVPISETSDRDMLECSEGTTQVVEALYGDVLRNPRNVDFEELVAECLVRSGLAPEGYDEEQYLRERSGTTNDDGVQQPQFSFDVEDPRFVACESDPSSS